MESAHKTGVNINAHKHGIAQVHTCGYKVQSMVIIPRARRAFLVACVQPRRRECDVNAFGFAFVRAYTCVRAFRAGTN